MSERIFKETERDFWLYPKLLLVVIGCAVLFVTLDTWVSPRIAIIGFLPFFALFAFIGRPVTYRQWTRRVLLMLLYSAALVLILGFAQRYVSFAW